jgi:predicted nucleic acid-binding protein
VEALLVQAEKADLQLLMSAVNLGEVWYTIARAYSSETADEKWREIQGMAIRIVDADWELAIEAAQFKAGGKMAYADCFAAALAKKNKAELITGDPEFKQLAGQIMIRWLPQK